MSILNEFQVRKLAPIMQRKALVLSYDTKVLGHEYYKDQLEMSVTIGLVFEVSPNDSYGRKTAVEVAEKLLLRRLYAGVLEEIAELRSALHERDYKRAVEAMQAIEKEIGCE